MRFLTFVYLAMVAANAWAADAAPRSQSSLTVIVYDYVGLKEAMLSRSEQVATRVLGITVSWAHCTETIKKARTGESCEQTAGPTALVIHVVPKNATRRGASVRSLGYSVPDESGEFGMYCGVFYDRVQQVSRLPINKADVLGHAMAHELGHLLLGVNAHTTDGLMSAQWTPRELALAAQGKMLFREEERRKIQSNILARNSARELMNARLAEHEGGRKH